MARGSVSDRRKRGRGWEARWYTIDGDGKRKQHSHSCKTKVEAERYLGRMLGEADRGESLDPALGKASFGAVANSWLQSLDPALKPKTRSGYESIVREHLMPAFGMLPVGAIKPGDVHRFLNSAEVGPGTKRNIVRVLNPIMNLAVLDGRIRVNPVTTLMATFKLPRVPGNDDPPFLTPAQVQELADEVGPPYDVLVLTAAYTGLRSGELSALRVKDIDLENSRLRVRESVSDVDGTLHFVSPKTGKPRSMSLPRFLVEYLEAATKGRPQDDFVFAGESPLRHRNFYARRFKPAVKRLVESGRWPERLASLRFHDLRHTAAAILIANGEHPKAVQERLGHSSIVVTMDRYGKLYEGHDTDVADRLDKTFRTVVSGVA